MLCVKTGMESETAIVKKYVGSDVQVLSGAFTADLLNRALSPDCTAIISIGLCGALSPEAAVGMMVICNGLVTPDGPYASDTAWRKRLFAVKHDFVRHYWSSGLFNTANSPEQRAALFAQNGCWVIDDETYAVGTVAKRRGIPFQAYRAVSDGTVNILPPAVLNALKPDGTVNVWAVAKSVATNPLQIPSLVTTALNYRQSLQALEKACQAVGPYFQWEGK